MKRSSVFVLCILLYACSGEQAYNMDELVGEYQSVSPSTESFLDSDSWFSNTSGWDYDHPTSYELRLYEDSTYDIDCIGGGFECVSDYWGTWIVAHDTIYLTPEGGLVYVGLELARQAPSMLSPEIFAPETDRIMLIQSRTLLIPVGEAEYAFARVLQ